MNPIDKLNAEISDAITNFSTYHSEMELMRQYYLNSVYFAKKSGQAPGQNEGDANLLRVFADKLVHYTSGEPTIKVPASAEDRENASIREKILYAVRRKSNSALLRRRWSRDANILSAAVCETAWDFDKQCAFIRRYDPRHCFWQLSNDNDQRVIAFWAVFPITLDECIQKYGVTPTSNGGLPNTVLTSQLLNHIDGKTWFLQAIKWTADTRTAWVGNEFIEEPHNHGFGEIPIDICMPIDELEQKSQGGFYLRPLLGLQAELNHTLERRSRIVDRMASPVVWGRGIIARGFDDVKNNLQKTGGGFVGLGRQGELGLLQVSETKMLDEHENRILSHMMRISGFGAATFGESVGANTSGDALGMYFTPTQRLIEDHNVAWTAFDQSINAKILKAYDKFLPYGEKVSLDGYAPGGTIVALGGDRMGYESGAYTVTFTKENIAGNYNNVVIPRTVTPKDENEEKRWALDAVNLGMISRNTAYEMIGILSPEDELRMLTQEKSDPLLNPEGTSQILQAANSQAPVEAASGG